MALHYKTLHPLKYYRDFLDNDVRPDCRTKDKTRPVNINIGSIKTADGSAIVNFGSTTVVCGIKAELGKPKAEEPDKGFLVINVDLPPICSPKFRPGPVSAEAQAMTCFVSEIFSNVFDLKQLCISADHLAWVLHTDLICLDYDGSVEDACVTALTAALQSVRLPKVEYDSETKKVCVENEKSCSLSLLNFPTCSSFALFDEEIMLTDPTREEENLSSARLLVVTDEDTVFSVHKPGGSPLSDSQIQNCISMAKNRASLVNKMISTALK